MKVTQADLDSFNNFVRDVHKFQTRLAAEVMKNEFMEEPSLEGQGKSLLSEFDKFIKKLEKL